MMCTMSNTQNNSMTASCFCTVSAATKNIKHFYYQVIQDSCIILTYHNPDWFCSVSSGISVLLPLGPTHKWCSNASIAFSLQGCEKEESEPSSSPPCPPTALLFCLHLGKNSRMVPATQQDQTKGKRGGLSLERDISYRLSKPTAPCIKDLSLIQGFCFLFLII